MFVLRDKITHRPLALGFSREGLQFTTDDRGRYIFFKKAKAVLKNGKVVFEGDLSISDKVYIEFYTKRVHKSSFLNSIEQSFERKSRQFYGSQGRRTSQDIQRSSKSRRVSGNRKAS